MTAPHPDIDALKTRRTTAIYRLDLIARGAQINYEDGTPIDMVSEQARLEAVVADLDRRIEVLERAAG